MKRILLVLVFAVIITFSYGQGIQFIVNSNQNSGTFYLEESATVNLSVYNIKGQLVATIVNNEQKSPGFYHFEWNRKDRGGKNVVSGIYFYRMKGGIFVSNKKIILLK